MSRNISRLEKGLILGVLIAVIFVAGWFLVVKPSFDQIGVMDARIGERWDDIARADELIARAEQIEVEYEIKKARAEEAHEGFYDELTTTEAITMVQEILNGARVVPTNGITVTDITEKRLSLELFTGGRDINYELRGYASLLDSLLAGIGNEEVAAEIAQDIADYVPPPVPNSEEEFFDALGELRNYFLATHSEEEAEVLMFQFSLGTPASRVLMLKEITGLLKASMLPANTPGHYPLSEETKEGFLDFMRYELYNMPDVGVGLITATFDTSMSYADYIAFLNYLQGLPELTSVNTAIFWQDTAAAGGEARNYSFSLELLVMKPMEIVDPAHNPLKIPQSQVDAIIVVADEDGVEEVIAIIEE